MTAKAATPQPIGMKRFNRPKAPAAPPAKVDPASNITMQIETTFLEDGSFWHRYKEIVGNRAGEWSEWMMLDLGDRG